MLRVVLPIRWTFAEVLHLGEVGAYLLGELDPVGVARDAPVLVQALGDGTTGFTAARSWIQPIASTTSV